MAVFSLDAQTRDKFKASRHQDTTNVHQQGPGPNTIKACTTSLPPSATVSCHTNALGVAEGIFHPQQHQNCGDSLMDVTGGTAELRPRCVDNVARFKQLLRPQDADIVNDSTATRAGYKARVEGNEGTRMQEVPVARDLDVRHKVYELHSTRLHGNGDHDAAGSMSLQDVVVDPVESSSSTSTHAQPPDIGLSQAQQSACQTLAAEVEVALPHMLQNRQSGLHLLGEPTETTDWRRK